MTKNGSLYEFFGWCGAAAVLVAYALVTWRLIAPDSLTAVGLNLAGGLGIAAVSLRKKTYQPAVLNVFWAIVALIALFHR